MATYFPEEGYTGPDLFTFYRSLGINLKQIYGQTETSPVLTQTWYEDTEEDLTQTIGQPSAHTELSIRNPATNAVVPIGEQGEICARAVIKARFLKKTGGVVPIPELAELFSLDPDSHPLPAWLAEWSGQAALPPRREPAPSVWVTNTS